jgi:ribosomal protein S18 acetylase RimI-like enzyme
MMVRGDLRGTKLASEMLSLALELAAGRGTAALRTDTHEDNKPMLGLLRKNGFKVCGRVCVQSGANARVERLALERLL